MKENIIQDKTFNFARKIIKLSLYLQKERKDCVISKQILRSGTSIGANIEETIGNFSSKEFLSKITISYKEARETHYWIRLIESENFISKEYAKELIDDCEEILKILTKIQKTMKSKLSSN